METHHASELEAAKLQQGVSPAQTSAGTPTAPPAGYDQAATTPKAPLYKSKTFWVNLSALIAAIIPQVREWIMANGYEGYAFGLLGFLNLLSRGYSAFFTPSDKKQEKETPPAGADAQTSSIGGSGRDSFKNLLIFLLLTLLPVSLVSCMSSGTGHAGGSRLTFEQNTPKGEITVIIERYKSK